MNTMLQIIAHRIVPSILILALMTGCSFPIYFVILNDSLQTITITMELREQAMADLEFQKIKNKTADEDTFRNLGTLLILQDYERNPIEKIDGYRLPEESAINFERIAITITLKSGQALLFETGKNTPHSFLSQYYASLKIESSDGSMIYASNRSIRVLFAEEIKRDLYALRLR